MALTGEFKELSFADIIQTYCITNQTVRILTTYENDLKGIFYIENGQIVDAHLGTIRGADAFFKALHHKDGKFQIDLSILTDYQSIALDWKNLLFEGMRLLDEHQLEASNSGGSIQLHSQKADTVLPPPAESFPKLSPLPVPATPLAPEINAHAAESDQQSLSTADREEQMINAFDLASLVSQDAAVKNSNGFSAVRQMLTASVTNGNGVHQASGMDLSIIGIDYDGDEQLKANESPAETIVEDSTPDLLDAQHLIDADAEIDLLPPAEVLPESLDFSELSAAPLIEQLINESVAAEIVQTELDAPPEDFIVALAEPIDEAAEPLEITADAPPEEPVGNSSFIQSEPSAQILAVLPAEITELPQEMAAVQAPAQNTEAVYAEIIVQPETVQSSEAAFESLPITVFVNDSPVAISETINDEIAVVSSSEMEHDLLLRELLATGVVQSGVVIDEDGSILCEIGESGEQIAKLAFLIRGLEAVVLPGFGLGDFNGAVLEVNSQALMIARSNDLSCAFFRPGRVPKVRAFDEVNKVFDRVFSITQ